MAWPSFPTVPSPTYPVPIDRELKILESQFGDGYTQDVGDGINAEKMMSSEVYWENIDTATKNTIEAFLEAPGGVVGGKFLFDMPGYGVLTFTCKKFTPTYTKFNNWTFTASFVRRFDVA